MTATGNLLGTAVSGLLAYQRALATTGHNVANVNTPGYSRQSALLNTQTPLPTGSGFIGTGVTVSTVTRAYDQFISTQLRTTTANQSELAAYNELAKQVDNVVADPQAGLTPAMEDYFKAVQAVANDPNSAPARQVLLTQSNSLANRFHYLNERLDNLQELTNSRIRSTVQEVNSLGQSIGELNDKITAFQAQAGGQPPNDLMDQRDEAIRQLAELVAVGVVHQSNGTADVFIGNGQTLVLGSTSGTLSVAQNAYDPQMLDINFGFNSGAAVNITNNVTGGKLGGILTFRNDLLTSTRNKLGRVAVGFTQAINAQHALGLNQGNALGGDFFTDMSTQQSVANRTNAASTDFTFTGTVTDIGGLQASDYRVSYLAGTYTVTRLSDQTVVGSSAVAAIDLTATEGFSISSAGTTITDGDSFLLRMVGNGARDFGVEINQTSQIAAAAPLRARLAITNTGDGKISQGSVSNATGLPLGASITLSFDPDALGAGIPGFTVTGGPGGTLAYDPATESAGKSFTFPGYGGYTFKVSNVPAAGDQFVIENNTNATSDNRNMLQFLTLQSAPKMINGVAGPSTSFEGAYSQMVSDVGAYTRQSEVDLQAQNTLLNQATESWSNISGVNLDEEAANLIRFQQAYQASAQLVNSARTVFDTLLAAARG